MLKIKKILVVLSAILMMASALLAVYLGDPARVFKTAGSWDGAFTMGDAFDRERVNLVLLGFDRTEERDAIYRIYRPDTIMIASISFRTGEIALVNIPRDSYVLIAGTDSYDKINHAYMYGYNQPGAGDPHRSGINATIETIEHFLGGVPVHFYVSLDMDGLVEIIDRVGGIDYEVEHQVRADFGRGGLLLDQGYQHLDGSRFLTYIRDRSVGGDTGRSLRQQRILIAALEQIKKKLRPPDIIPLYRSWQKNTETNLSPLQLGYLSRLGLKVDPGSIKTGVFPGTIQFAPRNGVDISYIVIDEPARVKLIGAIFGVSVAARPQIILPGPRLVAQKPAEPPATPPAHAVPNPDEPEPPLADEAVPPGDQVSEPAENGTGDDGN
jgi:LCP family protein required for cell wall assembly